MPQLFSKLIGLGWGKERRNRPNGEELCVSKALELWSWSPVFPLRLIWHALASNVSQLRKNRHLLVSGSSPLEHEWMLKKRTFTKLTSPEHSEIRNQFLQRHDWLMRGSEDMGLQHGYSLTHMIKWYCSFFITSAKSHKETLVNTKFRKIQKNKPTHLKKYPHSEAQRRERLWICSKFK